jgi:GLPGLI family protein
MKKRITLLLIVFGIISFKGQTNYKATYVSSFKEIKYDSIFKNNKKFSNEIKSIIINEQKIFVNISKKTKFILDFNINESKFYYDRKIDVSKNLKDRFLLRVNFDGNYYSSRDSVVQEVNIYGEDFLISSPLFIWKITQEKRIIGKYTCFKAITIKEVENSKGIHKIPVTAWFSKNIPFNYGPKEYSGLPGLIIELQEGDIKYQLEKIKEVEKVNFKKRLKGKKITLKEFNALGKEMYMKRKRM